MRRALSLIIAALIDIGLMIILLPFLVLDSIACASRRVVDWSDRVRK